MNVVLFGAPGSGKGTQAVKISEHFGIRKISLGDILRAEVAKGTDLGNEVKSYMERGVLAPDEVVAKVIEANVSENGFLLDGYPRNRAQAETLDEILEKKQMKIDVFLYLEIDEETIIDRLMNRGRTDDNREVIQKRWEVFARELPGVLDYYRQSGTLCAIDGKGTIEEVYKRVRDALEKCPNR
ncbi:MAG: adenylate kinase [Candidatus Omnitrophica bacterium]|nr:adenylate kinase [Candidatus Omnitrophota bacterium]